MTGQIVRDITDGEESRIETWRQTSENEMVIEMSMKSTGIIYTSYWIKETEDWPNWLIQKAIEEAQRSDY